MPSSFAFAYVFSISKRPEALARTFRCLRNDAVTLIINNQNIQRATQAQFPN
jgi:hypothetical protein